MINIRLADAQVKNQLGIAYEAYVIYDGTEQLGYCEFELNPPLVTVHTAVCDQLPLLDGVIRQSLSYALDHDCESAVFSEQAMKQAVMLKIVKNSDVEKLDILDFFTKIHH